MTAKTLLTLSLLVALTATSRLAQNASVAYSECTRAVLSLESELRQAIDQIDKFYTSFDVSHFKGIFTSTQKVVYHCTHNTDNLVRYGECLSDLYTVMNDIQDLEMIEHNDGYSRVESTLRLIYLNVEKVARCSEALDAGVN